MKSNVFTNILHLVAIAKSYLFIAMMVLLPSQAMAQELLYLSAGDAIHIKKIDPQSGLLDDVQSVKLKGVSSFTFSQNKQFLYAQARIDGNRKKPSIATFKVAGDGRLTLVDNALVSGKTTELNTDHSDGYLAGASYGKGIASVWKLEDSVYKGELVQEIALEKKAHAVRFSPNNKVLYVPATAPNKIFQLAFDETNGKVSMLESAIGPKHGAMQPRHLIFHPLLNIAYSTQERIKPGVAVWTVDANTGNLEVIQALTNSEDTSGRITNADLHMSADNKFLYISTRDKEAKLDRITVYKINANDGRLTLINEHKSEYFPRSFTINKTDEFIYVAGQKGNTLGLYKRNKDTGELTKVHQYQTGDNPIWVETLMLKK
ncbi:lactonase family protein [Thalassotalea crassostreae]|uniref:lactonase family protein n=1 Tax=Thalassotalea crassostreae TaxID=1763536 RepID=UPI0008398435|nr:beta-propeller fold lactonase family protein [Thalassotalea crassostreae]